MKQILIDSCNVCPFCRPSDNACLRHYPVEVRKEVYPIPDWCPLIDCSVDELENLQAEAEGQKARADWLDGLFRKACNQLIIIGNETGDRLWTAYNTPPQFDKDGIVGFVEEK